MPLLRLWGFGLEEPEPALWGGRYEPGTALSGPELQTEGCVVANAFPRAFTLWRVSLQLCKRGLLAS